MKKTSIYTIFLLAGLILTACQSTAPTQGGAIVSTLAPDQIATETPPPPISVGPTDLQILVPANDFNADNPRVPFTVYDGANRTAEVASIEVTLFELGGAEPVPVWTGPAENFTDYIVPYWVVYPPIDSAAIWGLQAEMILNDGSTTTANFAIETVSDTSAPDIGELIPLSVNRTAADFPVEALTSDSDPDPSLYQVTVPQLIGNHPVSVIAFNTPAYCQTAICSPVLDSIKSVKADYEEEVGFLHLEIFKEFDPLVTADEVEEWGLPSEPWTFVVTSDGRVTARLAGPVSPEELIAEIEKAGQ